jgi:PiT family inorganic phosphate transporter
MIDVSAPPRTHVDRPQGFGLFVFLAALLVGIAYVGVHVLSDLGQAHIRGALPFVLLGLALFVALGFEFVNGFHDTANAVATVIYTNSLSAPVAVVWSGFWNFAGVLLSTGVVAFGIVSLLPVELILQVGTGTGFAMVFALLVAAIVWNLGTWYYGLPSSSSHTLIGSIIGVGIANQLMSPRTGTSGVDWAQAIGVGRSLLLSPVLGFVGAALLLLLGKMLVRKRELYVAPHGTTPPPLWIRGLLILTCGGVSFAHGSNDGQKGMGLIMLILIGVVPTAYALNRAVPADQVQEFIAISQRTAAMLPAYEQHSITCCGGSIGEPRETLAAFLRTRKLESDTVTALRQLIHDIAAELAVYGTLNDVPQDRIRNFRNDLYVASESVQHMESVGHPAFSAADLALLKSYRAQADRATKFIPAWVKVAVALALGLGTMIGWKRIVITVGEKIGKDHLTYAQGAAAEITAMATIGAADALGLPVSTTHVLSSGIAGTMAANRSGIQWETVRGLLTAWVLTLPASIALSASLFWLFRTLAG